MKKQTGFTLVELVVVIVILGLLAVTAIPKYIDLTENAKGANIAGMAGGFATGVSLARSQWEVEGRQQVTIGGVAKNSTVYDGSPFVLTTENFTADIRGGYVTGETRSIVDGLTVNDCVYLWENIYQQPPGVASSIADINNATLNNDYLAIIGADTGADTSCAYHLKETLVKNDAGDYTLTDIATKSNFFTYTPADSRVVITIAQ